MLQLPTSGDLLILFKFNGGIDRSLVMIEVPVWGMTESFGQDRGHLVTIEMTT